MTNECAFARRLSRNRIILEESNVLHYFKKTGAVENKQNHKFLSPNLRNHIDVLVKRKLLKRHTEKKSKVLQWCSSVITVAWYCETHSKTL